MEERYQGFQDLPIDIAQRLERKITEARPRLEIPEGTSAEEAMRLIQEQVKNRNYSERELEEIVNAFNVFNNAVVSGLPNQLYQIMIRALNSEIGRRAYAANAIWYAHEGRELAKEEVQSFANWIKAQIDSRVDWTEDQFDEEYLLRDKSQL